MNFKPMLCYKLKEVDLPKLRYPLIVQPKIDGIRCCVIDGVAYSRTLKKIPNDYIRAQLFELWKYNNMPYLIDGELTIGNSFQSCTSGIMTKSGQGDFEFTIFDYAQRKYVLYTIFYKTRLDWTPRLNCIDYVMVNDLSGLLYYESVYVNADYEGIILRNPNTFYKFGRSTFNEQGLMALKRFEDAEAKIIGFEQKYSNDNEQEYDERGYSKRSSHQSGMTPLNTLGALKVVGINGKFKDVEFKIGTGKGLDDITRKTIWINKVDLFGAIVKYKFQLVGSKDRPRIPQYIGLRKD